MGNNKKLDITNLKNCIEAFNENLSTAANKKTSNKKHS